MTLLTQSEYLSFSGHLRQPTRPSEHLAASGCFAATTRQSWLFGRHQLRGTTPLRVGWLFRRHHRHRAGCFAATSSGAPQAAASHSGGPYCGNPRSSFWVFESGFKQNDNFGECIHWIPGVTVRWDDLNLYPSALDDDNFVERACKYEYIYKPSCKFVL